MKTLLTATALVLSMTAVANAAEPPRGASNVLGTGPIYQPNINILYCGYTNLGTASITPTAQMFYDTNGAVNPTSTTCANNNAIAPGKSCFVLLDGAQEYTACEVTFSGPATNVRGLVLLFDGGDNYQGSVEMR